LHRSARRMDKNLNASVLSNVHWAAPNKVAMDFSGRRWTTAMYFRVIRSPDGGFCQVLCLDARRVRDTRHSCIHVRQLAAAFRRSSFGRAVLQSFESWRQSEATRVRNFIFAFRAAHESCYAFIMWLPFLDNNSLEESFVLLPQLS
jgi:hypothetical protein